MDPIRWLIGLPVLRIALVAAASALSWVIVGLAVGWTAFPPPPLLAAVAILPVNIVCLWLVRDRLRTEGLTAGRVSDRRSRDAPAGAWGWGRGR